jgi:nicotinamide riboside transporter PnuC
MLIKMLNDPNHFRIYCFYLWYIKRVVCEAREYLVYPTGLIATIITVYLLYVAGYIGDMLINYFTIMSIYGWYKWSKTSRIR